MHSTDFGHMAWEEGARDDAYLLTDAFLSLTPPCSPRAHLPLSLLERSQYFFFPPQYPRPATSFISHSSLTLFDTPQLFFHHVSSYSPSILLRHE
jgi:hypothetical protein